MINSKFKLSPKYDQISSHRGMAKRQTIMFFIALLSILFAGCAGRTTVKRAVLQYDQGLVDMQTELLLLNVARMHENMPPSFPVISSVTAGFEFSVNSSISGNFDTKDPIQNTYSLTIGNTLAEKPTITFGQLQGEEYAKRVLSSLGDKFDIMLFRNGSDLPILLRLMAQSFVGTLKEADLCASPENNETIWAINNPLQATRKEYETFRRIVLHLEALRQLHKLRIERLDYYEDVGPVAVTADKADLLSASEKNHRWIESPGATTPTETKISTETKTSMKTKASTEAKTQTETKTQTDSVAQDKFKLQKRHDGLIALINFEKKELCDEQRKSIREEIEPSNPYDRIYVELRSEDCPYLKGYFRLRSFIYILEFLAKGVNHEYDVEPDKYTKKLLGDNNEDIKKKNPIYTLEIKVGPKKPEDARYAVFFGKNWFWVPTEAKYEEQRTQTNWNVEAFMKLYSLYQASTIDTSKLLVPPVITLPK